MGKGVEKLFLDSGSTGVEEVLFEPDLDPDGHKISLFPRYTGWSAPQRSRVLICISRTALRTASP